MRLPCPSSLDSVRLAAQSHHLLERPRQKSLGHCHCQWPVAHHNLTFCLRFSSVQSVESTLTHNSEHWTSVSNTYFKVFLRFQDCMSPYSYYAASQVPKSRRAIRCALAGSVCIDYSMIGALTLNCLPSLQIVIRNTYININL